ncbi:MAG: glycerol-3-phosphate acyltransferase [Fibrobacteres bacterium]|nr:glycerol-3-phosphate acyltransferase [Fibrobacterota bacterium]
MLNGFTSALLFAPYALCAYAVGCFSSGYYLVRWRLGTDIRGRHSGSTGARNVGRELGRAGFGLVFAVDALKGAGVIWIARALGLRPDWIPILAACVVTGHVWPAQLGFRGGKGLVTALGAMIGLDWRFLPTGLLLYFAPLILGARHRAARLLSGVLPMAVMPFLPFPRWGIAQVTSLALASALVLWAHRSHALPIKTRSEDALAG